MPRLDWPRLGKSVWACIVASFTPGLVMPSVVWLWEIIFRPARCCEEPEINLLQTYLETSLISLIPLLLIGLPIQAVLQRHGITKLGRYLIVAISLVTFLFCLVVLPAFGFVNPLALAELYTIGAVTAGIATTIFWLIRRPDLDAQLTK